MLAGSTLHPFVSGQPFRARYLDQALDYITGHPGVWLATSDEIAAHFARVRPHAQHLSESIDFDTTS